MFIKPHASFLMPGHIGDVPRVIKSPISYSIDKTSEAVPEHTKSFCLLPVVGEAPSVQ